MRVKRTHNRFSHRFTAALLCLCMIIPMMSGLSLLRADAAPGSTGGTQGVQRQADPSTMDTYQQMLDFSENTRYAGRLWSDKTVFALGYTQNDVNDRDSDWNGTTLHLEPADDGVSGSVKLDEDFLHVYSVLGSSQNVNTENVRPLDVVLLLDISTSMTNDEIGDEGAATGDNPGDPLHQMLDDANKLITTLMNNAGEVAAVDPSIHSNNRVGVVVYGGGTQVLMELNHYTCTDSSYLTLDSDTDKPNGHAYFPRIHANVANGNTSGYMFGDSTYLQGALYQGMNMLVNANLGASGNTENRVPVLIVLSDGGTNVVTANSVTGTSLAYQFDSTKAYNDSTQSYSPFTIPENSSWHNPYIGIMPVAGSAYDDWMAYIPLAGNPAYGSLAHDTQLPSNFRSSIMMSNLLLAGSMQKRIEEHYNTGVAEKDKISMYGYSILLNSTGLGDNEKEMMYATLDPANYLNANSRGPSANASGEDKNNYRDYNSARNAYTWLADEYIGKNTTVTKSTTSNWANGWTAASGVKATNRSITFNFDHLAGENAEYDITDLSDLYYIDKSYKAESAELGNIFDQIVEQITTNIFAPVEGENDMGIGNAVTFTDPMGKYMEVKDVMGVTLFGHYYGSVKTAVYDYQWNELYISNDPTLNENHDPLPSGWYKGEPSEDGNSEVDYAGKTGDTPKLPDGCETSEEAWAAGWVFRVGYDIAGQFVPTLAQIREPSQADTKERQTVYTFYRLDTVDNQQLTTKDRETLHANPAYLPEGKTEDAYLTGVTYDGQTQNHLKTPGVYALADMRIWVENTGDYNDNNEHLENDANYDEALYINVPVNMLPLRKIAINENADGSITYETNIPKAGASITAGSPESASFPLRVFYSVGVSDEVLDATNSINMAEAIDPTYTTQNKVSSADAATARGIEQGNVEFFSNWYNPLKRYSDYATSTTDYTYGDPVTSFSPAPGNRYYLFEKALPLYNTAYIWVPNAGVEKPADGEYKPEQGSWKKVAINENGTDEQTVNYSPTDFGGRLLAQDLEPTPDTGIPSEQQQNIWEALDNYGRTEGGPGITTAREGDIILLKNHRLSDVTKNGTDPFPSDGYFYLAIEFYELSNTDNKATKTQYVITRKGSEFGSAYKSAGISNGDMLVWHDMSGKYPDYPYLSATDTGDNSRGRDWIGWPLDEKTGYYVGCDKRAEAKADRVPSEGEYEAARTKAGEDGYNVDWNTQHNNVLNTPGAEWVVCAKPGGLRVGGLSQAVQQKTGDYTGGGETAIQKYYADRYQTETSEYGLSWGFYANNVTRTANNYYLPTISTGSTSDDVRVNTYLGNNGRLYVQDTLLTVTKLVQQPLTEELVPTDEMFNFQVFIAGVSGAQSAVVVKYNNGGWQRQLHYIDLELDTQLFLQTQDGLKTIVAKDGCRLIPNNNFEILADYVYATDCKSPDGTPHKAGDPYDAVTNGGPYYVFIGTNEKPGDIGVAPTSFRAYHNDEVDGNGSTDDVDVTYEVNDAGVATIYATTVWLVSTEKYNAQWMASEGAPDPVGDETFNIENNKGTDEQPLYDVTLSDFELMTVDPTSTTDSTLSFTTPYLTNSAYWTRTLYFGYDAEEVAKVIETGEAFVDGASAFEGAKLDESKLYDQSTYATHDADYIAQHTAQFPLKHGYGLLFSGLQLNTDYRVTEKITDEQMDAGYTLKRVEHIQQNPTDPESPGPDFKGTYSVTGDSGANEESVNYINTINQDKTETFVNGDPAEPSTSDPNFFNGVKVDDFITYEIKWANASNANARVVIIDPLDNGVDFVSATDDSAFGGERRYCATMNEANTYLAEIYKDAEEPVTVDYGHVVIWVIEDTEPGKEGSVTLTVQVNENAAKWWDYDGDGVADIPTDPANPDDYLVRNRATVRVADNHYNTNTVTNPVGQPDKDETNIQRGAAPTTNVNGDDLTFTDKEGSANTDVGPLVYVGDQITYEITWRNFENVPALITVRDPLDAHVKLISASFDPETIKDADGNPLDTDDKDYLGAKSATLTAGTTIGTAKPVSSSTENQKVNIGTSESPNDVAVIQYNDTARSTEAEYESEGQVTWNLGVQPAGASGKVTLVVEVLSTATPVGHVDNTAYVKVNGEPEQQTKTIENPTPEVNKTEETPGDGERVLVGQEIDYVISWDSNDTAGGEGEELAKITVTDPLDPGVDFVSASYGDYTLNAVEGNGSVTENFGTQVIPEKEGVPDNDSAYYPVTIAYDAGTHTVTWTLMGDAAIAEGSVNLTVRVTARALVNSGAEAFNPGTSGLPENPGDNWNYRDDNGIETNGGQEVQNRGAVKFGNDADIVTELVRNPVGPVKEEVDPGDGEQVQIGDVIHYRIYWQNYHNEPATVTIEDPLDEGVDFVRAEFNGKYTTPGGTTRNEKVTLNAGDNEEGNLSHTSSAVLIPAPGTPGTNEWLIQYNGTTHTVTWNLGEQDRLAAGYVDLYVKVNENAHDHWQYGAADDPVINPNEKDHEVVNRAGVTVNGDPKIYTDVMHNPVPEKTETEVNGESVNTTPKEGVDNTVVGPLVKVGDVITYEISWKNGYDEPADVIITDELDPGVDFESASFKNGSDIVLTAQEVVKGTTHESDTAAGVSVSYNAEGQPVVTWSLEDRQPNDEGTVILQVRVNQNAMVTGYVDNQAQVTVGNNSKMTQIVENPTPELQKTETKPGSGMQVMPGDKVNYEISWNNYQSTAATVTVRDALDPGVNFFSASFTGDDGSKVEITWNPESEPSGISLSGDEPIDDPTEPDNSTVDPAEQDESTGDPAEPGDNTGDPTEPGDTTGDPTEQGGTVVDDPSPAPSEPVVDEQDDEPEAEVLENIPETSPTPAETSSEPTEDPADSGETGKDTTPAEPTTSSEPSESTTSPEPGEPTTSSESSPAPSVDENETSGTGSTSEPTGDPDENNGIAPIDDPAGDTPVTSTRSYEPAKPDALIKQHGTVKIGDVTVGVYIEYDPTSHEITWKIGKVGENGEPDTTTAGLSDVPAGYAGKVAFSVIVNDEAEKLHTYDDEGNFSATETGDDDNQILNQGGVTVGGNAEILTNIIPNPTEPVKDETEINDRNVTVTSDGNIKTGPEVRVGDVITYTITWQNTAVDDDGNGTTADIRVIDTFKTPGLEFVDAGFVEVDETGAESYPTRAPFSDWLVTTGMDATGHTTITWTMPEQAFGAGGKVWVKARITAEAVAQNEVINDAEVLVGDISQQVDEVHNPLNTTGGLRVTKTVTGSGDRNKLWNFTVELSGTATDGITTAENVNGTYGDMTFHSGAATFTLKHGESKTATGLPAGLSYTVTEAEENTDGYTTSKTGDTGTIPAGDIASAAFTNGKPTTPPPGNNLGNLTVTKTVTGEEGDTAKEWHFTVTLSRSLTGGYGDMTFRNGVAEFTLKHGESRTARNLPAGITYTVTEAEANEDGYTTTVTGDTGTIPAGGTARAAFVNGKGPTSEDGHGSLTVTKTVTGSAGDVNKEWHFTVTLGADINGTYGDMTFEGGVAEFTLKHGESKTATGLPADVTYTVTEAEANADGYTTTASGVSGTITDGGTGYASFVNEKDEETPPPPTTPDNPPDSPTPGNPTPTTPTDTPVNPPENPSEPPKTGESNMFGLWTALAVISLAGAALTSVSLVRSRRVKK